jgi:glycosyltransferase involved in cell wall biosynthesis
MASVSVVMAVHNGSRFLEQAVESILNQTLWDFEFIIINDGSSDGSGQILEKYRSMDERISLFHQDKQGLTKSLNTGIRLSHAEFIARMDADDVSAPNRLQIQVDYLSNHSGVVCLGAQALKIDDDGDPLFPWKVPLEHDEIVEELLRGTGGQIIHPLFLVRREALTKVGAYNEKYLLAQDYDLLLRLAEIGLLANLPDVLLGYRIHSSGATFIKRKEQQTYALIACLNAHDRRSTPVSDIFISYLACPDVQIISHADLARNALNAGYMASAEKHARQALPQLRRFSIDWLEMKKLTNVNPVKMVFYRAIAPACRKIQDCIYYIRTCRLA